jgi:diadenosine tetraphosphatase ApaH/serine/threonine PP2A family protein phosphatase
MRVAVLSDIHSNLVALEAVLAVCSDADEVWCLGDLVGYGPRPNEVLSRLRAVGALSVAGNHEWAAIGRRDTADFNDDAASAAAWTAQQLDDPNREFLDALPQTRVLGDFTLAHGSPRDPLWEYVMSAPQAQANLAHFSTRFCLVGHTHLPSLFVERDDGSVFATYAEPDTELELASFSGRALLNPGSVGQPRDGDPKASYLRLDLEACTATWRRVEYSIEETQAQMRAAALPKRLVERLSVGR